MKVGNFHYFILLLFSSPTYKIKLACTLPNQLCFQYFILLSSHQLVHSLFFSFLSLLFSHPHTSSHTYSSISTLLRLSFKFPLIFVILCCLPLSSTFFSFVCIFFNSSTYQCFISFDFSQFLTQVSHLGFFVLLYYYFFFVRYVCLLHFFLLFFFFFGRDFSFTVQTPCRPKIEFRPVFTKGFLIERVRRGFLV